MTKAGSIDRKGAITINTNNVFEKKTGLHQRPPPEHNRIRYRLFIALAAVLLSACNPKAIPTVIFPAKPESVALKPRTANINIFAGDTVNPDAEGQASPVQIRIFLAADMAAFDGTSFEQMFEFEGQEFDIKPKSTRNVLPGSVTSIEIQVEPEQRVIAVAAAFRDIGRTDWLEKVHITGSISPTMNFILSDYAVRYETQ